MPVLTVHNAEVKTAAVEIKTLTISGKQVTLAVFRQLKEELLIADDGTLNGVPWGTVNYHPDKCGDKAEHWHVVWQKGLELRRSAVRKSLAPYRDNTPFACDAADEWLASWIVGWLRGELRPTPLAKSGSQDWVTDEPVTFSGWPIPVRAWPGAGNKAANASQGLAKARERLKRFDDEPPSYYADSEDRLTRRRAEYAAEVQHYEKSLDEEMQTLTAALPQGESHASLRAALDAAVDAEVARRKRHVDALRAITDLPQLFIAV
jgi:hypothetical protein